MTATRHASFKRFIAHVRALLHPVPGGHVRPICDQWPRSSTPAVPRVVPVAVDLNGDGTDDAVLAKRVTLVDLNADGQCDHVAIHTEGAKALRPDVDLNICPQVRLDAAAFTAAGL